MDILEKLKGEKRSYITDFELATLIDLDLGDVVSLVEKASEEVEDKSIFIKDKKGYILNRDSIIYLFHYFDNIAYNRKIINLLKMLYYIEFSNYYKLGENKND